MRGHEDAIPLRLTMGDLDGTAPTGSRILRLWRRLPQPLRAVLSGLVVFTALQNGWLIFFFANMQILPNVPWNVPAGLLYLWFFFRYFNGRWTPASTSVARRTAMRAGPLSRAQWMWSLAFLAVFMVFLTSVVNVVYRFITIPEESMDLSMFPWWSLYPSLVMLAINAGVSEEAGFRGYMQGGLERRYHPAVAIGITAFLFWVLHLNHANGMERFAVLLAMGIGVGALTYCAGSIWPAIVTHATLDTIAFTSAVSGRGPDFIRQPPLMSETGLDAQFFVFSALLVLSTVAGVLVLRRLAALRGSAS